MKFVSKTLTVVLLLALMLALMPGGTTQANAAACYWAQFIADVTVPDGTHFAGGTTFKKTWRLKNIGTCAWNSNDVSLIFATGDKMGGPDSVNLPTTVAPGQTVDISLDLTAPSVSGHYIGYYKFKSAQGAEFGIGSTANKSFWVEINVNATAGTGYDFTAEASKATWTGGAGALTFPGTDNDAKGFAIKQDAPKLESGVTSSKAGLLFGPNNITNGYVQGAYPAFKVQNGDRFQATIGCEQGAVNCYVAYRLDYQIGSGPVKTFWTFREKYEGWTYNVNLNLSALAGQDVKFILVTSAYGSPVGDRAIWVNPIIARQGGGTTPPPPPPPSSFKFDFGTSSSPVASGYSKVTEATAYSNGAFGWTDVSGVESRDRTGVSDDLNRDFAMHSSAARTFKVDLPSGSYSVSVTIGDKDYAHDNIIVKANGTTVLGDVDAALGAFISNTFNVNVTSGSLQLEFSDGGGSDPTWVVNALTITPLSTVTPIPNSCDRAQFIADVTVPDGTSFAPGFAFSKTWRLKNVGTCTWSNYSLMFDTGEKMGGPDSATIPTSVAPGQTVDITIQLTSPTTAGTYRGYWKLKNNNGVPFGLGSAGAKSFWVEIKVAGTGTVPNTPGTPSTPIPSAGKSYDFVANVCAAKWFSGAGELPCPGTEGDAKGFVLTKQPSKLENGTSDNRAGLLTVPQNINNGYIQGFYPAYKVKSGDKFRTLVNCEHQATACYVIFQLDYSLAGSNTINQAYWAFVEKYEGGVYAAEVDLTPLVGKDVKFILTVKSAGPAAGDRALWVEPYIYNASSVSPTPTNSPTATPTPTATGPAPTTFKFDFGTSSSPVASGFTGVTEAKVYSAGGFGWTESGGLESRDRAGASDDAKRDFVMNSSSARTFKVDLPNGNYSVSIAMGDNDYAHDNMVVKANGNSALPDVDNATGAYTENTFTVTVSDGSLRLEFSDLGGSDPTWIVNSITISPAP